MAVDAAAKTVTTAGLDHQPPAYRIQMNMELQRIAAHLQLPTREFKRLLEEYPTLVEPALGLAEARRELGKQCPGVADFLNGGWTVDIEQPDPTKP
jgi:hypothetical protein